MAGLQLTGAIAGLRHSCHLFDSRDSVAAGVGAFFRQGLQAGDNVLAVMWAVNFGHRRAADALRLTCEAHAHLRTNPRDLIATFLLQTAADGQRL